MRKKLNMIEHRKRRKKKWGVREKIKSGKDVEEPHAKKRKEEKVSLTKTMLLVGFLASVSICSGITKPQGLRKETAVEGSNQSDDLNSGLGEAKTKKIIQKSRKAEICHIRFFIYQNPCVCGGGGVQVQV